MKALTIGVFVMGLYVVASFTGIVALWQLPEFGNHGQTMIEFKIAFSIILSAVIVFMSRMVHTHIHEC